MSRRTLSLTLSSGTTSRRTEVAIDDAIIAGWTGRDPAAVEKHVRELEALGVKRPASTPIFYRVGAARLTTGTEIEAVGTTSGGEVEFVLLQHDGRLWVGAGSDHTDRAVETYGVTVSKQMCDKPLAPVFWAFDEVAPHWDQLTLRAHVVENGERKLYQEGGAMAASFGVNCVFAPCVVAGIEPKVSMQPSTKHRFGLVVRFWGSKVAQSHLSNSFEVKCMPAKAKQFPLMVST
jgi:Protein of unknown function (DUF2848)